jgi:hypothetical protein
LFAWMCFWGSMQLVFRPLFLFTLMWFRGSMQLVCRSLFLYASLCFWESMQLVQVTFLICVDVLLGNCAVSLSTDIFRHGRQLTCPKPLWHGCIIKKQ